MAERQERTTREDPEVSAPENDRRAARESRHDERPVTVAQRAEERRGGERLRLIIDRIGHGIDYLFFLLYGLIALRFVLSLLGASEQAAFVRFIRGITEPFYAPFSGIVSSPSANGGEMDFPALIALLAYALLHMAVRGLLRVLAGPRVIG